MAENMKFMFDFIFGFEGGGGDWGEFDLGEQCINFLLNDVSCIYLRVCFVNYFSPYLRWLFRPVKNFESEILN